MDAHEMLEQALRQARSEGFKLGYAKAKRDFVEIVNKLTTEDETRPDLVVITEQNASDFSEALATRVEDLNIGVRTKYCLRRQNIDTVEDITKRTLSDLQDIRNFGRVATAELTNALEELGIKLAPGPYPR